MANATPYIEVMNLTKRIGARVLFHDISFSIGEREHVGLIAKNGTGKSTLLGIIAGEARRQAGTDDGQDGFDGGKIIFRNGVRVGFLEQTPHYDPDMTVGEACLGHADELRTKQILTQLKITDMQQRFRHLSGGMVKRVALARLLEKEPNLILLDEPTNHLDIEMIEWLEKFLSHTTASLLMVTHDRYFLDRVCNTIIELDDTTLYTYQGNYAYYLQRREERIEQRNAQIERANNLYRTELEWMRRMPQARGHKAKYREEAFYELEKVARQRLDTRQLKLEADKQYIGSKIFVAKGICKAFGNKQILTGFDYTFSRYEKMGIVGDNGTGKTTFIRMLLGMEQPDKGHFDIGKTVRFGYYSQEGMELKQDARVIDVVRDIAEYVDLGKQRLTALQLLQHFLFTPEQQYSHVCKLSGGEQRRLYLCTVLMKSPNFLILDEPTNDLDIITLQILEQYLEAFQGCLLVVSHDRYFMDKVVDHILVFQGNGQVQDFPGSYSQYRQWKKLAPKPVDEEKPKQEKTDPNRNQNRQRRLTWKERQEFEQLGQDIDRLEAEKKAIETALSSGAVSVDEITRMSKRLPQLNDELEEKSMRWLELSEIA